MNKEIKTVKYGEKGYPKKLMEIKDAPRQLNYIGELPDENKKTVAIVGARNASEYGMSLAKTIARTLADYDIQIISGLAMGIDTSASLGAIEKEKKTFAVVGSGADICFPMHNQNIYERIVENGGIISELEKGTPPMPQNFALRDRIISGLSDIVIIVEARKRSGSLITADYALEQGKTIFCCPGRVGDSLSEGTNNLIKQGAYIFTDCNDIVEHLGINYEDKLGNKKIFVEKVENLDYFEKLVYEAIGNETLHIDQLLEKTRMPIIKLTNVLMSLQMCNLVENTINYYYRKVMS